MHSHLGSSTQIGDSVSSFQVHSKESSLPNGTVSSLKPKVLHRLEAQLVVIPVIVRGFGNHEVIASSIVLLCQLTGPSQPAVYPKSPLPTLNRVLFHSLN